MKNVSTINMKVSIENIEEYKEKINKIKMLVDEINKTKLKVKVVEDEMQNLIDCANEVKNSD